MAAKARNPLDPYTLNIGRLCHEWNEVETRVGWLFANVAKMPDGPVRNMIAALSVRDQIAAIRIGLVTITEENSDERYWCEQVDECLSYIDYVLRPRRNRYVHDIMWDGYYGVMRSSQTVKVRTPQARQPARLDREVRVESLGDLRATVRGIRDAWIWIEQLVELREWIASSRARGEAWEIRRPKKLLNGPTGQDVKDLSRRLPPIPGC